MTTRWKIEAEDDLAFIDGLPVGVYELTRDGRLLGTNRAFRYLVGADRTESPSDKALTGFLEARASSSTSGSDFGELVREYELLRPDGSAIWVRDQSLWSSDSESQRGVLHNVSARKASERALVSSERRHRLLVEMASNGIVAVNGEQQIVLFNQQAEELFGYRSEEVFGQTLEVLIPERFRQKHVHQMAGFSGRRELSGMYSEQMGLVGLRKDGSEFPLELAVSRQELDGESLYTAIVRDVTRRSEIERALQISEEQFRSFFESSRSAMLVEDFSSLVPWFKDLRSEGVNDLGIYLDENPGELEARVASLRVVDANQAAVDLYEAGSRDAMCRPHRPEMFGFSGLASFREQFIGIWNGQSHIELDVKARSWKGSE